VSIIAAPPGCGKSSFELAAALSIATGKTLVGRPVAEEGRVWIYNNEEDKEELFRRYLAYCSCLGIDPSSLRDKIRLSTGYGKNRLVVARRDEASGRVIPEPIVEPLIEELRSWRPAVFSVDPFVSTHVTNENSNGDLEGVMSIWRYVAAETGVAISLPSHIPKNGGDSEAHAGNLEAVRGASAIGAAARIVNTLARMSPDTARKFDISDAERRHLVRLDEAKSSYTPKPENATWLCMHNVCLRNHPDRPDWVGVFRQYDKELKAADGSREAVRGEVSAKLLKAVEQLGLMPGEERHLNDVKSQLRASVGKSESWIYDNIKKLLPRYDPGTGGAVDGESDFCWDEVRPAKGGKPRPIIRRVSGAADKFSSKRNS
jgi:RecA-family ATPase